MRHRIGRLHVVTDSLSVASAALAAGAPVIQVRCKARTDADFYDLVCRVMDAARPTDATVMVNDRLHVALAAGAHGVHVGEHDLPVAAARRVLGADALVGGTARDPVTAQAHEAAGASYLGVGPTFTTTSKEGLPPPLGPQRVGDVVAAVGIPVFAIAGVTADRVPELIDRGVYGVAVISAISLAADPGAATEDLLRALDKAGVP